MKRRFLAVVLSLAVTSLFLAGCGDDDEGSAPIDNAGADIEAPSGDTSSNDDPDDRADEPADQDSDSTGSEVVWDHSSLGVTQCIQLGTSIGGVFARGLIGDFDEAVATVRAFAAGASPEDQADVEIVLEAYEESYAYLKEAGIDFSDQSSLEANPDALDEANAIVETPEVEAAIITIEQLAEAACPDQG